MDKKPDKYDEAANDLFNIFDTANTRDFKWAWVKRTLRSSFPPIEVSEDALDVAEYIDCECIKGSDLHGVSLDRELCAKKIEAFADKRNAAHEAQYQELRNAALRLAKEHGDMEAITIIANQARARLDGFVAMECIREAKEGRRNAFTGSNMEWGK